MEEGTTATQHVVVVHNWDKHYYINLWESSTPSQTRPSDRNVVTSTLPVWQGPPKYLQNNIVIYIASSFVPELAMSAFTAATSQMPSVTRVTQVRFHCSRQPSFSDFLSRLLFDLR